MSFTLRTFSVVLATLLSTASFAQTVELSAVPSDNLISKLDKKALPNALEYLMESGVSLTYLGDAGGVAGYLGESPTGKIQTFYITPDGNHVIAGVLFRHGGVNVTGVQINDMRDRFENAKMRAESLSEEISVLEPSSVPAPVPSMLPSMEKVSNEEIQAGEVAEASIADYKSKRNVEQIKDQLDRLAWFSVGASNAPHIYMVVDPNCPHCHRAWTEIRPLVMSSDLSVRVIMIGALKGSRDKAISILSREEPGRAWFAGEGSTAQMPVAPAPSRSSKEYKSAVGFLKTNEKFVTDNVLESTPYIFAFDKNGELYESMGWPKDDKMFLSILDE